MDLTAIIGTLLGCLALILGQLLGGGAFGQLFQLTAFFIVAAGTLGATLLSFPWRDIAGAFARIPLVYQKCECDPSPVIDEIVNIAGIARKEGLLAIEGQRAGIQNELFKKAIKLVIDGFDEGTVREIVELELARGTEEEELAARVFETAGGMAPTVGIIGAVLGLIQVLSVLNEPAKIGVGIASAFIATIYGLGLSTLILFPWCSKLRRVSEFRALEKQVVKHGVAGIQGGMNPHFLREKLQVFVRDAQEAKQA